MSIGCDTAVLLAVQAGQLELNVMMPIIAHNLFEMMQVMIGAVKRLHRKGGQRLDCQSRKRPRVGSRRMPSW